MTRKVITFSLHESHAKIVLDAAKATVPAMPNLGQWVAQRIARAAAEDLGIPLPAEPPPAMPTRDRIRTAARAAGLSEDEWKAKVIADAVSMALRPDTIPPPAQGEGGGEKAKHRSGEYSLGKLTPAQAYKAVGG